MEGEYGKERWGVFRNPKEGYRDSISPLDIRGVSPYASFSNRRQAMNFARDTLSVARGLDRTGRPIVSASAKNDLIDRYKL